MANAIVRTDNMSGTFDGSKIKTARYKVGSTATAIDNGNIVKLSGLVANERDIYNAVTPTANDTLGKIALVASTETNADETKVSLDSFTNEAGANLLVYVVESGDEFSVTAEAVSGTPDATTNKYFEIDADTKIKAASAATNARFELIGIETVGSKTFYVVRAI